MRARLADKICQAVADGKPVRGNTAEKAFARFRGPTPEQCCLCDRYVSPGRMTCDTCYHEAAQ